MKEIEFPENVLHSFSEIQREFIKPFAVAGKYVLETQTNTPVTVLPPYLKSQEDPNLTGIAGIVSVLSEEFNGTVAICFSSEVFLKIYENMVGETHSVITPELEDAAGEIMNMIYGKVKVILNDEKGFHLQKIIPIVLVGDKLRLRQKQHKGTVVLPYKTPIGEFRIEILVGT